jgi:hypothetical protein
MEVRRLKYIRPKWLDEAALESYDAASFDDFLDRYLTEELDESIEKEIQEFLSSDGEKYITTAGGDVNYFAEKGVIRVVTPAVAPNQSVVINGIECGGWVEELVQIGEIRSSLLAAGIDCGYCVDETGLGFTSFWESTADDQGTVKPQPPG